MKHTDAQIEEAARRFEQLADNLDPASVTAEDLSDLRAVVTERVAAARARGRSWNRIGRARRVPAGSPPPVRQQGWITHP